MRLHADAERGVAVATYRSHSGRKAAWKGTVFAALLAASSLRCAATTDTTAPLLIAPILQGMDICEVAAGAPPPRDRADLATYCLESGRSAATLFESTLAALGPARSAGGRYEVGYTLPVPLLTLYRHTVAGWAVDERAVERVALTVRETNRPVIVYLFSTHFAAEAPIEDELFREAGNAAVSPTGPLPKDRYFGTDIYPWSLASTENSITRRRQEVIERVLDALCRLPEPDRRKIRAITLLGELQHFHADFERGMGIGGPYVVSDYSSASVQGFRAFLAARFGTIEALNRHLGETLASFADVDPPSKDFRSQPGVRASQHIDSFAHGRIPLTGWSFDPSRPAEPVWIRIHLDGVQVARVPGRLGRQDVAQARPAFGTADVGWRFDLDFTAMPPGEHRLDFLAERPGGALRSIGSRRIRIAGSSLVSALAPPAAESAPASGADAMEGHVDQPQDGLTYLYNPLVPLWHEYRGAQVVRYLVYFERQVRASCLGDVDLYTHQIAPFTNPSWDATKFAVDASLREAGGLKLGISLYGEPLYGKSFFDWLATTTHRQYGITEFHPLKPMSADEVRSMLDAHRRRGASFISFFMSAGPESLRTPSELGIFGIEPGNRNFGSDRTYDAIRAVIAD